MLVLCFVGGPACGKGTQAKYFKGAVRVTSSEVLDALNARDKSSPALVDDSVVIPAVANHLKENHRGAQDVVFDGFPRTLNQVDFVVSYCERLRMELFDPMLVFVHIGVTDGWALDRNRHRWDTTPVSERRQDDDPRIYEERLRRSHIYIPAVLAHIDNTVPGTLLEVSGMQSPDEVHAEIADGILRMFGQRV